MVSRYKEKITDLYLKLDAETPLDLTPKLSENLNSSSVIEADDHSWKVC
jgi:hypothetical protein